MYTNSHGNPSFNPSGSGSSSYFIPGSNTSRYLTNNILSGLPVVGNLFGGAAKAQSESMARQFQEYMARLGMEFSDEQRRQQNEWKRGSQPRILVNLVSSIGTKLPSSKANKGCSPSSSVTGLGKLLRLW